MTRDCHAIQEALTEARGEVERLEATDRHHVELCPTCREVAAAELALGRILRDAIPPADEAVVRAVRSALRPMRARRRLVALIPVVASFAVALLGAALIGGVPGAGILALLPTWSAQGLMHVAASAADWSTAIMTSARAAARSLDAAAILTASLIALLGLCSVGVAAVRWRKISPWRENT